MTNEPTLFLVRVTYNGGKPSSAACASEEHSKTERTETEDDREEEDVWDGLGDVVLVAGGARQVPPQL